MGSSKRGQTTRQSERGATLFIFTLSLFLLVGMGALAIDLASMYVARNQSQRAADAAALAGAKYFVESGCVTVGDCDNFTYETTAIARATEALAQPCGGVGSNCVEGQQVSIVGTPTFNTAQEQNPQITVQVQSANLRLYFIPAFAGLANILGSGTAGAATPFQVGATATAEAYNPSGFNGGPVYCTGCLRPWLIPNCDQTIATGLTNGLCVSTAATPPTPAAQAYLLTPGSYGVQNPGCTPAGVVGEQIEIPLETPTSPGLTPPTTLYGAADVDNPGLENYTDYQQAITTCFTAAQTTCGTPTMNVLPTTAASLLNYTELGVDALLHLPTMTTGLGAGQDYIDTTVCPPQIHAGANNPYVAQGIIAQDSVIATSDSIVTAYIYDSLGPGYSGLAYDPAGLVDTSQTVNIVGFAQIFISQVDANGNVWGNILGVAGCGQNANGSCTAHPGSINGSTLLPVRLITPSS